MNRKYVLALALLTPLVAYSEPMIKMSCDQSVRDFFTPLVQDGVIDTKPEKINPANSINIFKLNNNKTASFYGMPIVRFFGYTDEPLFFTKGSSKVEYGYGIVVKEEISNVQAQLNSMGLAKAVTQVATRGHTAIFCPEGGTT